MKHFIKDNQVLVVFEEWDEATIQGQVGDRLIIDGDPPNYNWITEKLDLVEENGATVWKTVPLSAEARTANLELEFKQIDRTTREKIFEGFEYDGQRFSLSLASQSNWQSLLVDHLTNPEGKIELSTQDETSYELEREKIPEFLAEVSKTIRTALQVGRARKQELATSTYLPESTLESTTGEQANDL